ncbi:hypothetical protein KSP39_PZI016076 [Platanthera zijinensis]|uniref:Reverse transcriptase n=1 Tax=Platanthera zijinensis TaxID=2320716 RepID=A0AAP0G103_9ASPA
MSNILLCAKVQANAKIDILQILGHKDVKALSYLGIKHHPGKTRVADFDDLLGKIASKIRGWGLHHLSMAGQVVLINSTLSALPLHAHANSLVPLSVFNKIDSLLKAFLWSGSQEFHSIHYARWQEVCCPREEGGLGIINLAMWRRLMMAKVGAQIHHVKICEIQKMENQVAGTLNQIKSNKSDASRRARKSCIIKLFYNARHTWRDIHCKTPFFSTPGS